MLDKNPARRPSAGELQRLMREPPMRESATRSPEVAQPAKRHTVGRQQERALLDQAFEDADAGRPALITVAGEPGIGKTTIVEEFLADLRGSGRAYIARGRCSERLAGSEAYLPVLEVLESLGDDDEQVERSELTAQIAEQIDGRRVGPVQIVEEQHKRLHTRHALEERPQLTLHPLLGRILQLKLRAHVCRSAAAGWRDLRIPGRCERGYQRVRARMPILADEFTDRSGSQSVNSETQCHTDCRTREKRQTRARGEAAKRSAIARCRSRCGMDAVLDLSGFEQLDSHASVFVGEADSPSR